MMRRFPRLLPRSVCATPNVTRAVKRVLLRGATKAGGGAPGECVCLHHNDAYAEMSGEINQVRNVFQGTVVDGGIFVSTTITITETCCVNAVGTIFTGAQYDATDFELEQPYGTIVTDQEDETVTQLEALFHYASWQVLAPGVYTFNLVNRSGGGVFDYFGSQLKVVAFQCTGPPCACSYHEHSYNEDVTGDPVGVGLAYTEFADTAIILSQAINLTETCCVLAVGTILSPNAYPVTDFELEQPYGTIVVDEEEKLTINEMALFQYSAWEEGLAPGVYTYNLVNRAGAARLVFAAQLKLIAVTCEEV